MPPFVTHQNKPYSPGFGDASAYTISGTPYVTGSDVIGANPNNGEIHIQFPRVTKSVTVINRTTEPLYVHLDTRVNTDVITYHHYLTLYTQDDSVAFDDRLTEIYISMSGSSGTGSFELLAELTGIDPKNIPALSGSGINSAG